MKLAPSEVYSRQSVSNTTVFFIGQQHECVCVCVCVFVLCIRGTAPGAPRQRSYISDRRQYSYFMHKYPRTDNESVMRMRGGTNRVAF